jgi:two-component system OmpR family sensor kinase
VQSKLATAWGRISLRTKLTTLSMALIGLLVLVSSLGTIALLRTYLQQNVDTMLSATASALNHEDPTQLEARLSTGLVTLPRLPSDYYIAYLDADGNLLLGMVAGSSKVHSVPDLSSFTLDKVLKTHGRPFELKSAPIRNGGIVTRNWRMIAQPTHLILGSVVVALPNDANEGLLNQYRDIGAGFGILLLLVSGLAIWLTITSALRPLREVERTAALVADGDISKRLIHNEGRTEIARVSRSLNTMLNSIESAFGARNQTLAQMRRFVADASHELRTPLVSVRGYAELYRMGALKDPKAVGEAMERIESEAIRMSGLVESLLTLARLDENSKLEAMPGDLVALARNAAKDASVADKGREIAITNLEGKELAANAVENIEMDADQIRQVLTNLLANACRFSPENARVEIAIGDGSAPNSLVFEVRDHGEGIPKQLREKVFERFYRVDNSRNRETGGSGLGLSIVSTLVGHHHGTVSAHETPGGGATFRVELPRTH